MTMNSCRRFFCIAGLWLLAILAAIPAQAQTEPYPSKPVRIISD